MYKVADDYGKFLLNFKRSLENNPQLDADDGNDS